MRTAAGLTCLLAAAACLEAADGWRAEPPPAPKGSLTIRDLKFLSPTRGVGAGLLGKGRRTKPVVILTGDGGRTWDTVEAREAGSSLFFVNEETGWMVTGAGLWKTSDSGRDWTKLPPNAATEGLLRVCFLDERRGWAVGARKAVSETADGGKSWKPVAAAQEVESSPEYTAYNWVAFVGGRFGLITGASLPPQPGEAGGRRELPHLTIFLDTRDGGRTWTASTTSMFGRVTRVALAADGRGLGLIEFQRDFEFPSEVFRIDWKSGQSSRAFRRADCAVTDIAFGAAGEAYLAGVEVNARRRSGDKPGRLRVFRSSDLSSWTEMPVAPRAVARRAMLSVLDAAHAWVATDGGTILRLAAE
jgi:photosystem II stability/assembly factor-like uncharacterized protein